MGKSNLIFSDIDAKVRHDSIHDTSVTTGIDNRDLPYMEGLFRVSTEHLAGAGTHGAFRQHYSNGKVTPDSNRQPKWHDAVLDLYLKTGIEVYRTPKDKGILVVKCQDEVSANRQRLTHVEIISA